MLLLRFIGHSLVTRKGRLNPKSCWNLNNPICLFIRCLFSHARCKEHETKETLHKNTGVPAMEKLKAGAAKAANAAKYLKKAKDAEAKHVSNQEEGR